MQRTTPPPLRQPGPRAASGPAVSATGPRAAGRQKLAFDTSDNSGVGVATSLVVHVGIITASLAAWQAAPIAPPPEVVPVLIVSEVPGGIGNQVQTSAAEATDGLGETAPPPAAAEPPAAEAAEPEPVPQPSPAPAPAPATSRTPTPPPSREPEPSKQAAQTRQPQTRQQQPKQQSASAERRATPNAPPQRAANTAQPLARQSTEQRAQQQPNRPQQPTAPAQSSTAPGRGREEASLDDFDLPGATTSATGANSGGRNVPNMKGQQGTEANASAAGRGQVLGGDLGASLLAQVSPCWRVPENPAAARRVVTVRFRLTPEGRLRGSVSLVDPARRPTGNSPETIAVDRALTAVQQCVTANGRTGYELPADRYEEWSEVIIRIGLSTMGP